MFVKAIKAATGNPGQINGSRTKPAHGNAPPDKSVKDFQWPVRLIQVCIWKAGNKTSVFHRILFAYAYGLVVERCTFSSFADKHLVDEGVINTAEYHAAVVFKPDGYATNRNAVRKVHGAV